MSIPIKLQSFLKQRGVTLPDARGHLVFWNLFVVGLILDLWSKKAVFTWLEHVRAKTIIDGFLRFVVAQNDGAAFNLFAGRLYFLAGVSIAALLLVVGIFLFGGAHHRLMQIALAFFAAGICGNLFDRLFNDGHVRDFIDVHIRVRGQVHHWPAFNVADSLLCVAVGLLIISAFIPATSSQKHAPPQKQAIP